MLEFSNVLALHLLCYDLLKGSIMPTTLSLRKACEILEQHGLLRELIYSSCASDSDTGREHWSFNAEDIADCDLPFLHATYTTRDIHDGTLLFIKGNFKPEYLAHADADGLRAYVAEQSYACYTNAFGIIVNDARIAMSVLSAQYFGNPQHDLTIIGITGTKGKTTTAYFTHAILAQYTHGKTALFSSVDNCLDGIHYEESSLTTPESFDAFRMMRQALDAGMTHLVMEVSSQAYKVHRVDGIRFNVAAFLNISPDHISPIEHPTFEDYLYCKRQIVAHAERLVLNADTDYASLLLQDAKHYQVPVTTFARVSNDDMPDQEPPIDETTDHCLAEPHVLALPHQNNQQSYTIALLDESYQHNTTHANDCHNLHETHYETIGDFHLAMPGAFNIDNATAAIAIVHALGLIDINESASSYLHALETVRISGRMEIFNDTQSQTIAIVDYAHNYISVTQLLNFVEERYGHLHPHITLITGSTGDKAIDRRKEIVEAAQHRINRFIFTMEDTDTEDPMHVCEVMHDYVTDPHVESSIILKRDEAIETAIALARSDEEATGQCNILLAIGKGDERWIKYQKKHIPYEGDAFIIPRIFGCTKVSNAL